MIEEGTFKFAKYDMSSAEYDQSQAAQSAIDFITGLRQYRAQQTSVSHSEEEVMKAFEQEFDMKMCVDS